MIIFSFGKMYQTHLDCFSEYDIFTVLLSYFCTRCIKLSCITEWHIIRKPLRETRITGRKETGYKQRAYGAHVVVRAVLM